MATDGEKFENTHLCIDVIEAGVLNGDDAGIELKSVCFSTVAIDLDPVVVDDALLQMMTYIADVTGISH